MNDSHDFVLWVDVDIVDYPADLIEQLMEGDGIAAPLVLLEGTGQFYDIGSFIQNGYWAHAEYPYFDITKPVEGVGCVYIIPADIYRDGVRYAPTPGYTEHRPVMLAALQRKIPIQVRLDTVAWHAELKKYGMRYQ